MGNMARVGVLVGVAAVAAMGREAPCAPDPQLALARYFTAAAEGQGLGDETIDIDASIPKMEKSGHLHAIRRLPMGRPEYEAISTEGDRTVRQQVIARYLSAEVEAASLPGGSVAITPANYRFRFHASIDDGRTLTYIYEITPLKKRTGLMRGQVWINAASGQMVRQTGRLVRSPSMFIKSVNITRDTAFREGQVYRRTTRLEIDTRLVGRAELTVTERPLLPAAPVAAADGQAEGAGPTR